ncbi:MAG TPA: hemolysin III family protein [Rhizomicrobium sp.]|jgi:hemolysin III|nr:hemolysin III family protein [Rhizomicrobium sp.]
MTLTEKAERIYSHLEDRADAIIHVIGVLFAINAGLWLLFHVTGLSVVVSVSVYCLGLFAMLSASAAYNLAPAGRAREILRRFDHSAIFIMIAATYTPFAANRLGTSAGPVILAAIWVCATIGVALKMLFPRRFELASVAFYIGMGWMIVAVIKPLAAHVSLADFWLLIGGGFVYCAGVAFYLTERIPYHKAIWHAFVLAAAVLQFASIAGEFTG